MDKGKFVISLDAEYAWGRISDPKVKNFAPLFEQTRLVNRRLLTLFDQYEIPVTWALVGRMIEDPAAPTSHFQSDLKNYFSNISSATIYNDSVLNRADNSFVFDDQLVQQIKAAKVKHELATHTYNHIFFDEELDKTKIAADLDAALALAKQNEFSISSIVFPRNKVNHLQELQARNIQYYRAPDIFRYAQKKGKLNRLLNIMDQLMPVAPMVVEPKLKSGMVAIPGSLLFRVPHFGAKRFYPFGMLTQKAIRGLHSAVKHKKIFHLWFHPFNFGYRIEEHFKALEAVLKVAKQLRNNNQLELQTMQTIGAEFLQNQKQYSTLP